MVLESFEIVFVIKTKQEVLRKSVVPKYWGRGSRRRQSTREWDLATARIQISPAPNAGVHPK